MKLKTWSAETFVFGPDKGGQGKGERKETVKLDKGVRSR